MQGLSKVYPGNRKILENIHLSFYPDAKIGVLGVNGSGKSTLLRIMAHLWFAEFVRIHSTTIGCVPCEIALSNNNYRGYEVSAFRVNGR